MTLVVKKLILSFVVLLVVVLLVVSYVCYTQTGTRMAFRALQGVLPDALSIETINGTLADALLLQGIEFETDTLSIDVGDVKVSSTALKLLRRVALIEQFVVNNVNIVIKPDSDAATSSKPSVLPDSIELPLSVVVQSASLRNINITYGKDASQQAIDSITLSSTWQNDRLVVKSLNIDASLANVQSSGEIQLKQPYAVQYELQSSIRPDGFTVIDSTLMLSGNLSTLNVDYVAQPPYRSTLSGSIQNLLNEAEVLLSMDSNVDSLKALSAQWPAMPVQAKINVRGPLQKLSTEGTVTTEFPDIAKVQFEYSGQVQPELLTIENLVLEMPNDGVPIRAFANGSVVLAGTEPRVDLNVRWQDLQWPLHGISLISSTAGDAVISGSVDSYQAHITGAVEVRHESSEKSASDDTKNLTGTLTLSVQGDNTGLIVKPVEVVSLGGIIRGEATLRFSNQNNSAVSFTTMLTGQNINPAGIDTNWPGRLSVDLLASGSSSSTGLAVKIEKFSASGELREQPINAKARGNMKDGQLELQEFLLVSGKTRISADGSIKDTLDLNWSIDSENMNSLAPIFEGQLSGKGTARGARTKPVLTGDLVGKNFAFNGNAVEQFTLTSVYSSVEPNRSKSQLKVGKLALSNGHIIDELDVDILGALSEHSIALNLMDPFGRVSAFIRGSLDEQKSYLFELDKLELTPDKLGHWQLAQQSSGQWSTNRFKLTQSCVVQNNSKLCIEADISGDTRTFTSTIVDLPISLLARLAPVAAKIDGVLNGNSELRQEGDGEPTGYVQLNTGALIIESKLTKESSDSQVRFAPSQIRADLQPSGVIGLIAQFPLATQGGISANASVSAGREEIIKRSVSGKLDLQLPSLTFVNDYVPQVSQVDGNFGGSISLGGTLEAPSLVGKLELLNGVATFDEPGVRIEDLTLNVTADKRSQLNVEASAKSGDGVLTANGVIDVSTKKNIGTFSVSGKDFQVAGTPQVNLWVSPELELTWKDEQLNIAGKIVVPNATIDFDDLPDSAIRASKDQVLVDRETEKSAALFPVSATIDIELQNNVSFSGYGLQSKLQGQLELIEKPGSPTTAVGEISLVDGEYEAYGQNLTISTGRLLFVGGPIDAPGIDLRAVRNPTSELEVGITARGSLKQPEFTVFSTPSLSDSEELAYLIFGRPLNSEATAENTIISRATLALAMQGGDVVTQQLAGGLGLDQLALESSTTSDVSQVSLIIGKYLSPKLFVSYGIGLLEPVSTLKLEYALSSKWRLITESSSDQSGVDAQYVIER